MSKLSTAMMQLLKVAPVDWQRLIIRSPTAAALSRRGLVSIRADSEKIMCGWDWKITDAGRAALRDN